MVSEDMLWMDEYCTHTATPLFFLFFINVSSDSAPKQRKNKFINKAQEWALFTVLCYKSKSSM